MRAKALAVAAVWVIAGCGDSDPPATTAVQTTTRTTPTTTQKADAPIGKLSADEYRDIHGATARFAKAEGAGPAKALRGLRSGCARFRTQTVLVQRMDDVCDQLVRTARAIRGLETHKRECTIALNAGDVSCFSNVFRSIGRAARVAAVRQSAMNREVRRRKLPRACAKAIGASEKDVIDANAIAHDAISAANAAERRDGDAFTRATARLDQDFNSDDGSSSREDLKHLKTCR